MHKINHLTTIILISLFISACGGGSSEDTGQSGSSNNSAQISVTDAEKPALVLNAPASTNTPYQASISIDNFTTADMDNYARLCLFGTKPDKQASAINFNETWKSPKENEIDYNNLQTVCYTSDSLYASAADTQLISSIDEIAHPINFEQTGSYTIGVVLYEKTGNIPSFLFNDLTITTTGKGATTNQQYRYNSDSGLSKENNSSYVFRPQSDGSLFYYHYIRKYNGTNRNDTRFWSLFLVDKDGQQLSHLSLQEDFGYLSGEKIYDTNIMTFDDEYLYIKSGNILRYLRTDYRSSTPTEITLNNQVVADNSDLVPLYNLNQIVMLNDGGKAYLYGSLNGNIYRILFQSGLPYSAEITSLPQGVNYLTEHKLFHLNKQYYDLKGKLLADCSVAGNFILYNRDTSSFNCIEQPDTSIAASPQGYCFSNIDVVTDQYCINATSYTKYQSQIKIGQAYIEDNSIHLIAFNNDYQRFYNSDTRDYEWTSYDDSLHYVRLGAEDSGMVDEISLYPSSGPKNDVNNTSSPGVKQTLILSSWFDDPYLLIGEKNRQIAYGGATSSSYYQQHTNDYLDMNYLQVKLNQDKSADEVRSIEQTTNTRDLEYDDDVTFVIKDPQMDTTSAAVVFIDDKAVTTTQVINADGNVEVTIAPGSSGKGEIVYKKQWAYYQKAPITVARGVRPIDLRGTWVKREDSRQNVTELLRYSGSSEQEGTGILRSWSVDGSLTDGVYVEFNWIISDDGTLSYNYTKFLQCDYFNHKWLDSTSLVSDPVHYQAGQWRNQPYTLRLLNNGVNHDYDLDETVTTVGPTSATCN